jgi:hypothetical protein
MAVGRITGPLLAQNLNRDGVDLSFETDLLYLDVNNGQIGIKTASPQYTLDVNGTLHTLNLIADNTSTIGLMVFSSTTSSSTVSTLHGPISIAPSGQENIYLVGNTFVTGDVRATGNFYARGNIQLGVYTATDTISFGGEVNTNITPFISSGTYYSTVTNGTTVTTFTTNTSVFSGFNFGSTTSYWAGGYFQDLYANTISPADTATNITMFPNPVLNSKGLPGNALTINGDIRVYGGSPIGTAPVVSNVLYVTMDGNDSNDGRAEDASRACRTISGAVNSPFYKQGTVIKVRSGHYYENNPIQLLPYTSVIGDDLRTTFIEPLNKTVDLFHVNSGVYIAQMQFRNLRRGQVTRYAPGGAGTYTTGAYCVAFPPSLTNPIDLFYSPYIQNCTNQSGPWLRDGTMFVPNQTVQVPNVVATSTYVAGTLTLTVNVVPGTIEMIEIGNTVNGSGIVTDSLNEVPVVVSIQNPDSGFNNAAILLTKNKNYLIAETIGYINYNNSGFTYNQDTCKRDLGLIIDAIIHDSVLGGNEKSVEAGLAYWTGNNNIISNEISTTTNAISYLGTIAQNIIANTHPGTTYQNTVQQYIDTDLTGGSVAGTNITACVNTINDIIQNWAGVENAASLLTANRSFIQSEVVAYVNNTFGAPFNYDQTKCARDTGLIVDSISLDLMYQGTSQSNFTGLQYWNHSATTNSILLGEQTTTTNAINYIKNLALQIVTNTPIITHYQNTVPQVINSFTGTTTNITSEFNLIVSIINSGTHGVTDLIVPNGITSVNTLTVNTYNLLEANKTFLQAEAVAFVEATKTAGFHYTTATCYRDVGYIIDSVAFDILHSGNRQAIQAGTYYYGYSTTDSAIPNESIQTIAAYNYLKTIVEYVVTATPIQNPYQTYSLQNYSYPPATGLEVTTLKNDIDLIISIIKNGPSAAGPKTPIGLTPSSNPNVAKAYTLLNANRSFIASEIVSFINATFPQSGFKYNQDICYRDVGYIIDAVQNDILHKSNTSTIYAGLQYWNGQYTSLKGEIPQTYYAIEYAKNLAVDVISNTTVTQLLQTGTNVVNQVINYDLTNGSTATTSLQTAFDIVAGIVQYGPEAAPLTTKSNLTQFIVTLSTSTTAGASNDTIYFGDTSVYPLQDEFIPTAWSTSTNADRRIDPHGSGGGALVDGNAPSLRSPIQSFVFDAFTQVNQGGNGIHIINKGYAQLVSVFTIFCDVAVHCESGGICSITNSNSNFGDLCLVSEGFGPREFGGTIYNPPIENYPLGFYPYNQEVAVFVPNPLNRPHISLVMEVVPPDTYVDYDGNIVPYVNEQGFPGFLSGASSMDVLTTGSYVITTNSSTGIVFDTTDIAVGQNVYIVDQYGSQYDSHNNPYLNANTVVTKVEYQSITLSNPINAGGGQSGNANYFNIYTCGNAYYSILSSVVAPDPIPAGQSKITGQVTETIAAINYANTLSQKIISNQIVTSLQTGTTTSTQITNNSLNGAPAGSFIANEFNIINSIILTGPNNAPVVTTTGTIATNAPDAASLLSLNRSFIQDEVIAYVNSAYPGFNYNQRKCRRDVGLLIDAVVADLNTGGNFRAIEAGGTYYSKSGTYHIVTLEDNVRNPLLFVDGVTVNFYQRSYMSASGYLFEYVGAGTQYGALPQVGKADPIQSKEVIQLNNGKVFFTSTDQNGDFRIGPGLVISQATGVLSGRTFQKSLYAEMTPFILAVEAGSSE